MACLSVSSVLILAAALVPSTTATIVLWVLGFVFLAFALCHPRPWCCPLTVASFWPSSLLVEFLMYPLGLLTKYEYQLSVNTAHLLERNQLLVMQAECHAPTTSLQPIIAPL